MDVYTCLTPPHVGEKVDGGRRKVLVDFGVLPWHPLKGGGKYLLCAPPSWKVLHVLGAHA